MKSNDLRISRNARKPQSPGTPAVYPGSSEVPDVYRQDAGSYILKFSARKIFNFLSPCYSFIFRLDGLPTAGISKRCTTRKSESDVESLFSFQQIIKCNWTKTDQLDVTSFIISLFTAQHVSNVSTSIFRSLQLIVDLFHGLYCSGSMCDGVTVWFGWGGVVSLCRLKLCFSLYWIF